MKKQVVSLISVSVAFLSIFLVAFIVSILFPDTPSINIADVMKTYAVSPDFFSPEPQERLIYIISTLLSPILCAGLYLLVDKQIKAEEHKKVKLLSLFFSPMILVLLTYLAFLGLSFAAFKYLNSSGLVKYPIVTFVINIAMLALWIRERQEHKKPGKSILAKRLASILYWGLGTVILLLIGFETVFNEAEPYVPHVHFMAYFDSVVQVFLGKHLYVDVFPQYGLYAWFLNPVFQIIGLDVVKFTIVMGALKIIIYGSLLILLHKLLDSKLIAFSSFMTLFFYTRMRVPLDMFQDPYFQYAPHRMLFPVLFILTSWFYITTTNKKNKYLLYIINSIMSGIAILWNSDSGMVVMLSWVGLLIFQELYHFKKNKFLRTIYSLLRHVSVVILSYALVAGIFVISTYVNTGQLPHLEYSKEYIQLFYGFGYFMIRTQIVHPWNMIVLVYLLGIYFPIRDLINANRSLFNTEYESVEVAPIPGSFLFATSILGIGLFNYYVGRSHEYNLVTTVWPAYILLAIYIEKLAKHISPIFLNRSFSWQVKLRIALRNSFQVGLFLGLYYFLGSSVTSILGNLPQYLELVQTRISLIQQGMPLSLLNDIQAIKETSTRDDPVFIISDYAPELYLYTEHTRPLNIAGFGEIIFQKDINDIDTFLEKPPQDAKIYWDKRFHDINSYYFDISPYKYTVLAPQELPASENIILFVKKIK